jgi:DNA-binding PadR family transcriptional regulator
LAKINKTKYAILGVLNLMSGSGYDIKKFCDSSIGFFWNENYGHIYPVLQKMEAEELVTKRVEQTEGKPSKNIYSITQKGSEELEKWLKLPIEQESVRSELLLKIFLSRDIPVKDIIKNIQQIKEDCEKEIHQYSKIENLLKSHNEQNDRKKLVLWTITLNNGEQGAEAKIKWCDETLELLEEIKDL